MDHTRAAAAAALIALAALAPGAARALDLETALREIHDASPTLAAHRAHADAARHRIGPAGAWTHPELELALGREHDGGPSGPARRDMRMVGLRQSVPVFGANGLARRAARDEAAATAADARAHWLEVMGEGWRAYASAWHAAERAAAARAHVRVMERSVWAARARYGSGRGRLDEILRADAERARLEADAIAFDADAEAARARLDALRGRERAPAGADTLVAPPAPALPFDPSPLRAAVADAHPRVRESALMESSWRASAAAARRRAWPDLELHAERELGGGDGGAEWRVGAAVALPLFAGGRELARGAAADAMARAAAAERRERALALGAALDAALARAGAARRRLAAIEDGVLPAARAALDAGWSAYAAGTVDLARALDLSHMLYEAELEASRARESLALACARVLELTGRGDLLGIAMPADTER